MDGIELGDDNCKALLRQPVKVRRLIPIVRLQHGLMNEIISLYVDVARPSKGGVSLKVQLRLAREWRMFWPYRKVKTTIRQGEAIFSVAVAECSQLSQGLGQRQPVVAKPTRH